MKEGTQIIYVPIHISFRRVFLGVPGVPEHIPDKQVAKYLRKKERAYRIHSGILHIDCEPGFVTSVKGDTAFCRYWSNHDSNSLRTKSCSESTSIDRLLVIDTHPQKEVDDWIKCINKENEGGKNNGNIREV